MSPETVRPVLSETRALILVPLAWRISWRRS